jgi:hypothetical protein
MRSTVPAAKRVSGRPLILELPLGRSLGLTVATSKAASAGEAQAGEAGDWARARGVARRIAAKANFIRRRLLTMASVNIVVGSDVGLKERRWRRRFVREPG